LKTITWAKRIADALLVGKFSDDDQDASSSWPTCAIGERLGLKEDAMDFADQRYQELKRLGFALEDAVQGQNPELGRDIYIAIQKAKLPVSTEQSHSKEVERQ